jgi:hypothetical protein
MLKCKALEQAAEAYHIHTENTKKEYPHSFDDLLQPPWGGPSLLKNGRDDLLDPWGNPFQMEVRTKSDGETRYILITTVAPDGTPISQYGIGKKSEPPVQ